MKDYRRQFMKDNNIRTGVPFRCSDGGTYQFSDDLKLLVQIKHTAVEFAGSENLVYDLLIGKVTVCTPLEVALDMLGIQCGEAFRLKDNKNNTVTPSLVMRADGIDSNMAYLPEDEQRLFMGMLNREYEVITEN